MQQGKDSVPDFWNVFRSTTSNANLDNGTLQRLFLQGLNTRLQSAWTTGQVVTQTVDELAIWAIGQENRYVMIDQLQHPTTSKLYGTPRNSDSTFKPTPVIFNKGDPLKLDSFKPRRVFIISSQEYRRRRAQNLYLKCGRPGHRVKDCRVPVHEKEGVTQQPRYSMRTTWRPKPHIKEIEMKEDQ